MPAVLSYASTFAGVMVPVGKPFVLLDALANASVFAGMVATAGSLIGGLRAMMKGNSASQNFFMRGRPIRGGQHLGDAGLGTTDDSVLSVRRVLVHEGPSRPNLRPTHYVLLSFCTRDCSDKLSVFCQICITRLCSGMNE